MKVRAFWLLLFAALATAPAAEAGPVLMISIDGLRPADVLDAKKRGFKIPNLRAFVNNGATASGVRGVLPTLTYPSHTTLITGVSPAIHGISNNTTFDPLQKNLDGWYWYESDIRGQDLWDAVHNAHRIVANIGWPVSVGGPSIDYNIPEYWRAYTADDIKLVRALSTPGLVARLEQETGMSFASVFNEAPDGDTARTRFAEKLIDISFPQFMTVHLISLDHYQHLYGPGSPEAHVALEQIDTAVGDLVTEARKIEPDITVAVVSDHGFAPLSHEVNLIPAFAEEGLITIEGKRKIIAWDAMPWPAGGSAAIVLAHPDDQVLKDKVLALLTKLAADPANGIAKVIDKPEIEARGGAREASFFVDFRIGYAAGRNVTGALITASTQKGAHGFFPDNKEMRATFMIAGPGIKKRSLGDIDMRDIAPTLARVLQVPLPGATGKPLF
jgi:predicted AlkP superfamily pyrophosphatase or phosphodiesterase